MKEKIQRNKYLIAIFILFFMLISHIYYAEVYLTPKNSNELFQEIRYSEQYSDVSKLMSDSFESNFKQEDYDYMTDINNSENLVMQITLIDYFDKTFALMSAPGKNRIEVLAVQEVPENIKKYFQNLYSNVFNE